MLKDQILKLDHRCLDPKPAGGGGIFRNVTNRRNKELSINMKLGVIKYRQLVREGKSITQNSAG